MDGGTDGPIIIVGWRQTVEMVVTFTQSLAITRLPAQSHYVLHRKQVARKALELLAKGDQRSQVGGYAGILGGGGCAVQGLLCGY